MASRFGRWLLWSTVLCAAGGAASGARAASCEGLATTLGLPQTDLTVAQSVPAGSYVAPDGRTYPGLPAFCRVAGVAHPVAGSNIGFEVWLPTTTWNRKYQGVGNGGLAGSVQYGSMVSAVQLGYAAAGTDDGHAGSSPLWMGSQTQLVDFGSRAVHVTAQLAKEVIAAFYGARPSASLFVGCSEGGREALMEAQRFPEDYDGIIAGDPFNDAVRTIVGQLYLSAVTLRGGDYTLSQAPVTTLANAVLAQCDAKDGVTDGLVTDPRQCRFDPRKLQCAPGQTTGCLTAGQVDSAVRYYSGTIDPATGRQIYPGQVRSGEPSWVYYTAGVPLNSFSLQILPYAVFHDPNWNYKTFDYHADTLRVEAALGPVWNATDTNLEAFWRRGGKLIGFHGYSDWLITPFVSTDYYHKVWARTGLPQTFYRLFLAPGVGHCSGGPGPNAVGIPGQPTVPADAEHNLVLALDRWVTRDEAPERVVATKYVGDNPANGVAMTRPLCPYPGVAAYDGRGDVKDAGSFHCRVDLLSWILSDQRSFHTEKLQ